MKIIGLTFLFGFAAAQTVLASPEFAYPPEKWASLRDDVLEYEELADLIHEYNAEVINSRTGENPMTISAIRILKWRIV